MIGKMTKAVLALSVVTAVFTGVSNPPQVHAASLTLSKSTYYDKTLAGIIGQVGGVLTGYEFVTEEPLDDYYFGLIKGPYSGRSGTYFPQPWNVRIQNDTNGRILSDDDYHIDFFNQHILDMHGPAVTNQDIKDEWIEHQVNDWGGGWGAMDNMNNLNMLPPFTGKSEFNKFYWVTESYIENDTLGMVAPGMPQTARDLTEKFSSASGEFDAVTWAKFQGAMYAQAYFETDARVALEKASAVLPRNSWPYQIYQKVKALYNQNPNDWRWAQRELRKIKRLVYGWDNIQVIPDINNALTIMSIMYGNNDYTQSAKIASLSGYDADCTASFVMGLMGIIKGMSGTPQAVKDVINGNSDYINDMSFTPHIKLNYPLEQKFSAIAALYQKNAQSMILYKGGSQDANNFYINGEDINVTPDVVTIVNSDFEQGSLNGWQKWQPVTDSSKIFAENNGTALSGNWKGTVLTDNTVNEGKLFVTVNGLQNGATYRATAYLGAADGQEARLYVDNYGGAYQYASISSRPTNYSARSIEFVPTNGSAQIGLHVPAGVPGAKWAAIDNLTLEKIIRPAGTRYEAESAIRSGGSVQSSATASNGSYVGAMTSVGNHIQFTVNAPSAGEYVMRINYANGGTAVARQGLYVNDLTNKKADVSYPRSQRPGVFSKNLLEVPVVLNAGSNTIRLRKDADLGSAEVDYIEIAAMSKSVYVDAGAVTPPVNLVVNGGFEAQGATQSPTGWSTWPGSAGTHADADFTESGSHSGSYRLTHYKSTAYEVYTSQTVTNLTNGLYTLRGWVTTAGGQSQLFLSAKNFDSTNSELKRNIASTGGWPNWQYIEIKDIPVANGQCVIGFYSNAPANAWASFDDIEFVKQ